MTPHRHTAAWVILIATTTLAGCGSSDAAIIVTVDDPPEGTQSFTYSGSVSVGTDLTALDQLQTFAGLKGFEVTTTYFEEFDATIVESINGLEGQASGDGGFYFWKFIVNDEASDEGADKVVLSSGDQVQWRYVLE